MPTTHRNALIVGQELHWYRIDSVLGKGGFGITYLAYDTNLDRAVAIKEYLPTEFAVRESDQSVHPASQDHAEPFRWGLERFITEAQTLASFDHPNVVRVHSVFESNNTAYMVMQYEQGETLDQRLKRDGTVRESELLEWLPPLLDGLAAVHAAGFIHRDIKPANLFLRKDGGPVLIDFGSARQALGEETRTLTALISPGYAPYEQYYSKSDDQGPWTDIYALAATLYRCVQGASPVDAVERSRTLLTGEADALVPATTGASGYSETLLRAIDHGLAFQPGDRPRSVEQWRAELPLRETPEATTPSPQPASMADAPTIVVPPPIVAGATGQTRPWLAAAAVGLLLAAILYAIAQQSPNEPKPVAANNASMPASTAVPEVIEADIESLLRKANLQRETGHIARPPGDNALATYGEILSRDPDNPYAAKALREMIAHQLETLKRSPGPERLRNTERMVNELLQVVPESKELLKLKQRLQRASARLERQKPK